MSRARAVDTLRGLRSRPWHTGTAALVAGLLLVQRGEALPGTRLAGSAVGGLGEDDVRAEVERLVEARRDVVVEVRADDVRQQVSAREVGLVFDVEGTVDDVLQAGRDGGPVARLREELAALAGGRRTVASNLPVLPPAQP